MKFVIYEDNGGAFHWRPVGDDGVSVARSPAAFDSRAAARRAAGDVHRVASTGAVPSR
jgi:uncharacterized protein YegP (UPF0339 family)